MPARQTPGRSLVTRRAITDVVRAATLGSYGVTGLAGGPLARLLARARPRPSRDRPSASTTASTSSSTSRSRSACPVAEVARQVDSAVRYAVKRSFDLEVRRLVIHIDGLRVQPGGAPPVVAHEDPTADPHPRPRRQRDGRRLMVRRACDGAGLLEAFRAAVANLEAHVDEINALNVYPVPDGDTGSNMYATVRAALEEAEAAAGQPVDRVAAAISFGALMGARGNSGVITSQIFRGMAEGLEGKKRFNGLDLAHALATASKTAYAAVAKPVEGTILTVIRESADAAVAAAEHSEDIETVLAATVDAAEKSVARTPTLLAILREAGVVDSGGQGLYRLFQGALLHLVGQAPAAAARSRAKPGAKPSALVAHADEGFGYETMFLLLAEGSRSLDVDAIRIHLETIGESVLVAGRSAGAQGPRPQRAARPGHRVRPDARLAQPDQRREPRQPGARRPRDASRGVHRRAVRRRGRRGRGRAVAAAAPPAPTLAAGRHRGRLGRRPRRDLPRLRRGRRSCRAGRPRTRAPASCSRRSRRSMPARS